MKRKYSRTALRRIIKGKRAHLKIAKSADIAVYLSLILALNRLSKAASCKAVGNRETVLTERHIQSVFKDVLKSLKG